MFSTKLTRSIFNKFALAMLMLASATSHATIIRMVTPQGALDITLYDTAAPNTVANFRAYVNSGAYLNSFFHRSVPNFVLQGGGFAWPDSTNTITAIPANAAIANEFSATRSNKRGTIAMAKLGGNPNSATNQWFINLADNTFLDADNGGFTVFGEVSPASMSVADAISRLPIVNASTVNSAFGELPIIGTIANTTIQKNNLVIVSSITTLANTYQGMWWAGQAESGWGMNITQHGNLIFAAMYTYDATGAPVWYVIPNCPIATNTCSGDIYKVFGGTSPAVGWNGTAKVTTKVGSGTLLFTTTSAGTFNFTIDGVAGSKAITPQVFNTGTTPPAIDYSDMWWNPNESGWGLSITQQFNIIFAAWYTYDANGKAIWYVVPNCPVVGTGCTGALFRVNGGEPLTTAWNGTDATTNVGSVTLSFSNNANAAMTYTVNGVTSNRIITRQVF